jgi:hypothetical protein
LPYPFLILMTKRGQLSRAAGRAREFFGSVRPRTWLLAAGVLHVSVTCAVFAAGRFAVAPGSFNAEGIGLFARDGVGYRAQALALAGRLSGGEVGAWAGAPVEFHVKLYALAYAAFGPLLGHSIIGVEPLNLLYYLAAVWLVYRIGAEAFGRRAGLLAAAAVAPWPSFVLHTTQLVKDPLFVACMLGVCAVCVCWLARALTPWRGLALAAAAAPPLLLLARAKSNMWESVASVIFVAAALLAVRLARERRLLAGNLLCAALVVLLLFAAPVQQTSVRVRDELAAGGASVAHTEARDADGEASKETQGETSGGAAANGADASGGFVWRLAGARVARRRENFVARYGHTKSSLDADVKFGDTPDIVVHLPRAALVGVFAPFPRMWFDEGDRTGRAGRLLSGAETLAFYAAAALACVGLYAERRNLAAWLLVTVALLNCVALGLVVTNVGALFRLRYVFWMLVVITAARGALGLAGVVYNPRRLGGGAR